MSQTVLVEGPAALDVIIATYAGRLSETWPGDESLVGLLIQERAHGTDRTGIAWASRERVLANLIERRERERNPRRRLGSTTPSRR